MAWDIFYDGGNPPPSWIPSAGEVVTYTVGGGVLTNNLRAVLNPNGVGYTDFYSIKLSQYSCRVLHPTWRTYGGLVITGGGHSATNNNVVAMLTFGATTIYHECVLAPTNWSVADDQGNVTSELDLTYGEVSGSNPLQLASRHQYGIGNVVGGKFIQPVSAAWGNINAGSAQAAHELDLSNPSASYNSRGWARRTNSTGTWAWFTAAFLDRYVSAQNRIYYVARGPGGPYSPLWFDLSNNTWVTGTGTGFNYPDYGIESGGLLYVQSRDLLVLAARNGSGNVVIQYMNVASGVTQPTLGGTATLSETLAVPAEWGAVCWCPDNNRILVFGVTGNTDKVYEIAIPSTLSDTWTVSSYTLANSQTISPLTSANYGAYGKSFDYNPLTKSIVFLTSLPTEADSDSIRVYRPRNT